MRRVITLTTDFGLVDGYVAAMKGIILTINPEATIVDITHSVEPQNVKQGAWLFASSAQYFPPGTIHVVVVDPGVGGERRPLAMQVGRNLYVAPDNGVLSRAVGLAKAEIRAVRLDRSEYWRARVSSTFHGRDVFAPVAAHLSLGVPLEAVGTPILDWVHLSAETPVRREDGSLTATVTHIDRFGNVVIDVGAEALEGRKLDQVTVSIAGRSFKGIRQTYSQVSVGEIILLVNSLGFLEIAQRDANAAETLGIRIGDPVLVIP